MLAVGEQPVVSVVIPTINRASLVDAIKSVANQTYPNVELIVIGDGCKPHVEPSLLARLTSFQLISHPSVKRPAPLRNAGVAASSGEFVAFLDDDDTWEPEKLERQLAVLQDQTVLAVCSNASTTNRNDEQHYFNQPPEFRYSRACLSNPVILSSLLVRKASSSLSIGFPENPQYRGFEDHLFVLRLLAEGRVHFLDHALVRYQNIPGSRLSDEIAERDAHNLSLTTAWVTRYLWTHRPNQWQRKLLPAALLAGASWLVARLPSKVRLFIIQAVRCLRQVRK